MEDAVVRLRAVHGALCDAIEDARRSRSQRQSEIDALEFLDSLAGQVGGAIQMLESHLS